MKKTSTLLFLCLALASCNPRVFTGDDGGSTVTSTVDSSQSRIVLPSHETVTETRTEQTNTETDVVEKECYEAKFSNHLPEGLIYIAKKDYFNNSGGVEKTSDPVNAIVIPRTILADDASFRITSIGSETYSTRIDTNSFHSNYLIMNSCKEEFTKVAITRVDEVKDPCQCSDSSSIVHRETGKAPLDSFISNQSLDKAGKAVDFYTAHDANDLFLTKSFLNRTILPINRSEDANFRVTSIMMRLASLTEGAFESIYEGGLDNGLDDTKEEWIQKVYNKLQDGNSIELISYHLPSSIKKKMKYHKRGSNKGELRNEERIQKLIKKAKKNGSITIKEKISLSMNDVKNYVHNNNLYQFISVNFSQEIELLDVVDRTLGQEVNSQDVLDRKMKNLGVHENSNKFNIQ